MYYSASVCSDKNGCVYNGINTIFMLFILLFLPLRRREIQQIVLFSRSPCAFSLFVSFECYQSESHASNEHTYSQLHLKFAFSIDFHVCVNAFEYLKFQSTATKDTSPGSVLIAL